MDVAFAVLVGLACAAVTAAYWIGYRKGLTKGATWLVRPHTPATLREMPSLDDGTDLATVKEAVFTRTNLPSSTSKMD